MKSLVIAMMCIYLAAVLSAISGGPVVKRSRNFCEGKPNGLFPNPGECETFIQCSNGMTFVMPCPAGLHFNNASKQCDFPASANCDLLSEFCANRVAGNYKHPTDCGKFVACTAAKEAVEMNCPLGLDSKPLHFNETANHCQDPADAGCI